MATTKAKTAKKSVAKKPKARATEKSKTSAKTVEAKTVKKEKVEAKVTETKTKVVSAKATKVSPVKKFFARKGDPNENIITIFKDTKIIGALIAEIIGTAVIAMIALTLGLFNPLYIIFAYLGITLATFALSGAHLNPIISAGMAASRRISLIRAILYIIAQVVGSFLGFLLINAFFKAGTGATAAEDGSSASLPTLTALFTAGEGDDAGLNKLFWPIVMIEFIGAIILGFFYARALNFKRSAFTFAATVATGVFVAMLFAVVITNTYLGLQDNTFVLNPAVSTVYGLFPSSAEGFDGLMSALWPMLVAYVIFPIIGGILGFYLSDFAAQLSEQETTE
ncbi:aquaporin [Candidatus Saccharibacteria bacterium]|nr:aquaporin [Candidatus Saccharibacteria bacterium]